MPYLYILECSDGSYHTGSTWDIDRRLWQHNEGLGANYTARRRPVTLVFCHWDESIAYVFQREKQIQGWSRAKKRALIESRWNDLVDLAKSRAHRGGDPGPE